MKRIGKAGLVAALTLFSGCVEKTGHSKIPESTKQLVMTAARKGYEFGSNGDSWESLSNKLVQTLGITVARAVTISNNFGTPFLTISNRPYMQFDGGSCVVRVTDAEWHVITNQYPEKIGTNRITFYGE